MTDSTSNILKYAVPLVGMYFRPPAQGIVAALTEGQPLKLHPEPENPYAPYAIAIHLDPASVAPTDHAGLVDSLESYAHTLQDFLAQDFWHLGYVSKDYAKALTERFSSALTSATARYGILATGKPAVLISIATESLA